jgi:hypothetical protein
LTSSIAQYVESIFLRFDKNKDNQIGSNELKSVLDHIVPSIRMLIKQNLDQGTQDLLYRIFPEFERDLVTFMIKHKELPEILKAENPAGQGLGALNLYISNLKDWVVQIPDWFINGEVKVTREDFFLVVGGLSYFQRTQRVRHIKDIFWENDFKFDDTISDIDDPVFLSLRKEILCSSKITDQVRKWLVEKQKEYWVKAKADEIVNLFGLSIKGSSLPFNDKTTNWTDAVMVQFISLLYNDPQISPLCNLPYISGVQRVRKHQGVLAPDEKLVNFKNWERAQEQGAQIKCSSFGVCQFMYPQPY